MKNNRLAVAAFSLLLLNPVQAETPPADELERSVALMAKVGACWSPSFSPDGTRIAFVSNMSGVPQIYIMPATGGFPEQVTALDDAVDGLGWSPTGEFLAFAVAPGGGLNTQIYIVKPDGSEMRRLTDGGKENNYFDCWSADGKILAISSNRRDPATTDSYFVDLGSGKLQMVAENKGVGGVQDISRDNRFAIIYRLLNRGDNNLYLIEVATGKEELLTPHEPPGSFGSARFAPDGQTIYFTSNKDRDLTAFARVRLGKEGKPGDIEVIAARDDAEAAALIINDEGTKLALLWNVAGKNELAFFDIKTGRTAPGPHLPGEIVGEGEFSKDGSRLALVVSGAAAPRDIHVLDLKSQRFTQISRSPHAGVDLATMVRPELLRYKADDGLELSGSLYRPKDVKGPAPVVLNFHGGPEGQERPNFSSTYQALSPAALPCSPRTCAAPPVSESASSISIMAPSAKTAFATSRPRWITSSGRRSRIRAGSGSWAGPTAATW